MADASTGRAKRQTRVLPDKGQRVVLVGFTIDHAILPEPIRSQLQAVAAWPGNSDADAAKNMEVWVPIATVEGDKLKAIEQVAVNTDGKEVPGRYRAPTSSSWRGGVEKVEPIEVPLQRSMLD